VEFARSNPPPQRHTPPPDPESNHLRASTPDPDGHWLFASEVETVIEQKCIPFYIRALGDRAMDPYDGCPARTVPVNKRTLSPQEGEVVMKTVQGRRPKQISIHPRYLEPWKPLPGCEVVITNGRWFGTVGVAKRRQGEDWSITFTVDDDSRDFLFQEKVLAPLEPLK
jgi:hypothetical protein